MFALRCLFQLAMLIAFVVSFVVAPTGDAAAAHAVSELHVAAATTDPVQPTGAAGHRSAVGGGCLHGHCTATAGPDAGRDCLGTAVSCGAIGPAPAAPAERTPASATATPPIPSAPLLAGLDPSADPPPPRI